MWLSPDKYGVRHVIFEDQMLQGWGIKVGKFYVGYLSLKLCDTCDFVVPILVVSKLSYSGKETFLNGRGYLYLQKLDFIKYINGYIILTAMIRQTLVFPLTSINQNGIHKNIKLKRIFSQ